jgi:hypothetical protein
MATPAHAFASPSSTGGDAGGRLLAVLEQLQLSFGGLRSAGTPVQA